MGSAYTLIYEYLSYALCQNILSYMKYQAVSDIRLSPYFDLKQNNNCD